MHVTNVNDFDLDEHCDRQVNEIEVSTQMIEAGLIEFREHHYDVDVGHMLESVYRAMAYAKPNASSNRLER